MVDRKDLHVLLDCIFVSQSKREDSDLKSLQDAMKKANEMDAIFLEDIKAASPKFRQIMTKSMWHNTYLYYHPCLLMYPMLLAACT